MPEELAEVQLVGRLTLDRNPTNYFAETEQVAFHTGNLVPGIEVTDDPLMQARLFSNLDTQLTRLGGPNFTQLPINCPHAAVNDNLRDGMHQTAIHTGTSPYLPNSIDGSPRPATEDEGAYVHLPREIAGPKLRANPGHIVEAFTVELGKCQEQPIWERMLDVLAQVDTELCAAVAAGLGLPVPAGEPATDVTPSPALSQVVSAPGPIAGRVIGVVAAPGSDLSGIGRLRQQIVERTFLTARSIEFDPVVVAAGNPDLKSPKLTLLLQEAFRPCKAIGAWGDGVEVLRASPPTSRRSSRRGRDR